ncbi:hypothetical protein V5F53_02725 [Xanthobacter sp. V4C-4]|uniref:hypothetical protein n=1 Tax=Xanthobacter cornucopiae TaxID=3119924 RepID=UPI00372B8A9E
MFYLMSTHSASLSTLTDLEENAYQSIFCAFKRILNGGWWFWRPRREKSRFAAKTTLLCIIAAMFSELHQPNCGEVKLVGRKCQIYIINTYVSILLFYYFCFYLWRRIATHVLSIIKYHITYDRRQNKKFYGFAILRLISLWITRGRRYGLLKWSTDAAY